MSAVVQPTLPGYAMVLARECPGCGQYVPVERETAEPMGEEECPWCEIQARDDLLLEHGVVEELAT